MEKEKNFDGTYVLHGALDEGQFCLWMEKKCLASFEVKKKRGRKPLHAPPEDHPFAATEKELDFFTSFAASKEFKKGLIILPTGKQGPFPSTPIISHAHTQEEPSRYSFYFVPTCVLSPKESLSFLLSIASGTFSQKGVILGKEFAFLGLLARWALSLIIRQKYVPAVIEREKEFWATWTPVFLGKDQERLSALKKIFPPCCRALTLYSKHKLKDPQREIESLLSRMIHSFLAEESKSFGGFHTHCHDRWLEALLAKHSLVETPYDEGVALVEGVAQWQRVLKNQMASPFKFCFRLEEPPEGRKEWRVNYLLQSFEDPSLIVSTEEIWNPKGIRREILNYPDFNLRQFVLMSLGMALGVCPEIKRSLEEQVPQGYFLDNQGAFEFLESQAGGLEELGFGLICPNWWNREKSSIAAKAFVKSPFSCSKQGSLWDDIQCEWAVYIGKLKFSLKELREIALLKSPLVKLRGQWMVLKEDQLSQAIAFLKKPYQPQSLIDLLQIDGGISDKKHGISIEGVESEGWVKEFLEALKSDQSLEVIEPPKGFQGRLRPYQQRGYSWMSFLQKWKIGALLADDMGLGKTPQTLALIMQGWEGQKKQKPSLLVCPTSLLGNWAREAEKFVPSLPIYVHHGSQRPKGEGFLSEAGKTGLVLTSYALLYRDLSLFKQCGWNGIILDEAQNIKNTETRQTQASYQLQGEYRLALTGTPVENNVGDLYSLMHFLNPGYLGTQQSFRQQFYKPIQIEHNPSVVQNLKRLTAPFILRRLKTDRSIISDLPDKIEQNSYCSLTKEQVSLYESVIEEVNALLEVSEGIARKGVILSTFSKLKQICNHPVNFLKDGSSIQSRSGKLLHLEELLGEIWAAQERTLIFTQYTEMGSLLVDYLEEKFGKEVIFLHGGVRKKDRDLMVKRFQEEESGPEVFILSIKAGGVGLNLTRANHVVHYDRWWNPAVENQATDRAFRIGQAKTVQVHKLVCMGTIEEKIDAMIKSKKEISESAVGVGEQWLTELSNETLQDLWKLQKDLALC